MALATHLVHHTGSRMASGRYVELKPPRGRATVVARPPARRSLRCSAAAAAPATATTRQRPGTSLSLAPRDKRQQRAQETILTLLQGVKGRGKSGLSADQLQALEAAVAALEASGGVQAPAASRLLEGRWRLLYTSRPGTASPIQRTFTAVDSFSVFQDITWNDETDAPTRVDNVVVFGSSGGGNYLRVEADASTERAPLPGFTPRRGAGLPLLGKSLSTPPAKPDTRVDFRFDRAAFTFKLLPFKIPYPVPFRWLATQSPIEALRDEVKGWIDVTYLSPDGRFRLSRGNKGTLFLLAKELGPKERLLDALSGRASDAAIEALAQELASSGAGSSGSGAAKPARSEAALGKWRLLWTRQGTSANPLQRALAGSVANWQILRPGGELENLVQLPGLRIRALASCEPDSDSRTGVVISEVVLEGPFGLRLRLPVRTDARGFVDWLYLDSDLRVTEGSKGSLFIHRRDDD